MGLKISEAKLRKIIREEMSKMGEGYGGRLSDDSEDAYWDSWALDSDKELQHDPHLPAAEVPPGAKKSRELPGSNLRKPRGRSYREDGPLPGSGIDDDL